MRERPLTMPTIHLNGSSPDHLVDPLRAAYAKLTEALEALGRASPNGRDYYPQGPTAIRAATDEHQDRAKRIRSVQEELCEMVESIETQSEARKRG